MTLNIDQKTNFKLSILLLPLLASVLLLIGCSLSPNNSSSPKTEALQEGDLLFQDLNCGGYRGCQWKRFLALRHGGENQRFP